MDDSNKKMITLQHLHDSWQERVYIKYNSLVLVQENIERVKTLGVVIGESGRGWACFTHLSKITSFRDNLEFNHTPFYKEAVANLDALIFLQSKRNTDMANELSKVIFQMND